MTTRILVVFDDGQQARSLTEADSIVLVVVYPLNIKPRTECAHVSELRPTRFTFRHFCALPFSPNLCSLLVVSAFLGMGFGLVGLNMFPLMGHIADLRHTQIYGSVYAISDVSCSLAFVSGPIAGGPAVRYLGFTTMLFFLGMVNFAFAPLMIFLRKLEKTKHKNMLAAWSSAAIVPEIPVISEKTKNFGN
uniref:MFS domain-containing protein n=1 Tax=Bursaphelenchus xylophilus TaxID=6326 RepID=A0A1I7SGC4_BURXY